MAKAGSAAWTYELDTRLLDLYGRRRSLFEMAEDLGLHHDDVRVRIEQMASLGRLSRRRKSVRSPEDLFAHGFEDVGSEVLSAEA